MNKSKWEYKKWNDVIKIINGRDYKSVVDPNGAYPICGSGGIMGYANSYLCPSETVIIGRKGNINKPIYMNRKFWNVDTAFGLVADKTILSPKYLYYFCEQYDFDKHNKAVTIPSLTKRDLLKIVIPIPPLDFQNRIVSELDQLSAIISLKQQQMKEYDALAQSLFYEMFGDENNQYNGFQTFKLSELFEVGTGSTPSRKLENIYYGGTLNWVKTTEIHGNYISETEEKITRKALEDTNCKMYPSNTILIAMYGQGKTRGQTARLTAPAATNQACAAILPKPEICNTDFLFEFFLLSYERIRNMARGGTQSNLNLSLVKSIEIPLPPLSLQHSFAEKVKAIEHQKSLLKQSIAETQTLLDSRMQEYFG